MTDSRTFANRAGVGADGSVRKAHYGDGEQPWDMMLRLGWGPDFAAGCVLRYLRRTKDEEHSTESARWYLTQLEHLARSGYPFPHRDSMELFNVLEEVKRACRALQLLANELSLTEKERIEWRTLI